MKTNALLLILLMVCILISGQPNCAQAKEMVVKAEDMLFKSTGARYADGSWNIYCNGFITESFDFPEGGKYNFTITARGDKALNIGPFMTVTCNSKEVFSSFVDSSTFTDLHFAYTLEKGYCELTISFVNDYYDTVKGEDRNLYVGQVAVETADSGLLPRVLSKIEAEQMQSERDEKLMDTAEARIQKYRTAEAELTFVGLDNKPLKNVKLHIKLTRHEFKLGACAWPINEIADQKLQQAYNKQFSALLNYATLPSFYWGDYERKQGNTGEKSVKAKADWCRQNSIIIKGHPLIYHLNFPEWAKDLPDEEVLSLLQKRVTTIVSEFKGLINIWDVFNEATASPLDNAIGRWTNDKGAADCVGRALDWAHQANAGATLLYNDCNVSKEFEDLLQKLRDANAPLSVIGIQSHMHKGNWPLGKVWSICETYSRFGLPLHFTELTILSGDLKTDDDWHTSKPNWLSTPEGEQRQLEYGQKLYTLLFSHPSVEAVTFWDFSDMFSWQGAPAGLIRKDLTPKPLYNWLMDAFHKHWTTDTDVRTDDNGHAKVRAFFGDYEARAKIGSRELSADFTFSRKGSRQQKIVLSPHPIPAE